MTIDERLDMLTERHEALTLHVEFLTAESAQTRANLDRVIAAIDRLMQILPAHEQQLHLFCQS